MNNATYVDLDNCTKDQKRAWRRLGKIYAEMYGVWDVKYLDSLMKEGEELWNEYFPFQASSPTLQRMSARTDEETIHISCGQSLRLHYKHQH